MDDPLFGEFENVLSVMKRQNEVIKEVVLKEPLEKMKLIVCSGERTDDSFNLKSFNKGILKKTRRI
jgi:hypothetical protein|nr:MAG TPA: hypothetical protein [Caudoviricetes sp.]